MRRSIPGLILVVLGVVLLGRNLGWWPIDEIRKFWPLILIAIGVSLLARRS